MSELPEWEPLPKKDEKPEGPGGFYTGTKKKRKINLKLKMALLEIIERKRMTERVDYKAVAIRHATTSGSLRQLYASWKRGEIDLGEPETPEEKQIDARMLHEKTLILIRRYKALILHGFEAELFKAEDAMTNGDGEAWKKVSPIARELKNVTDIQAVHEKGYASILEDLLAQRERVEKKLTDSPLTPEMETKILHANDEERAMAALGG